MAKLTLDDLADLSDEEVAKLSRADKRRLALELNQVHKKEFGESLLPEQDESLLGKTMSGAAKALDYLRGIPAAAIAQATGAAPEGTISNVLSGKQIAPSYGEIMGNLGVPEGGSLSDVIPQIYSETGEGAALQKGGMLDPTTRGAVGFGLDVLLDPTTWVGGGVARLAKSASGAKKEIAEELARAVARDAPEEVLKEIGSKLGTAKLKNIGAQALDTLVNPVEKAMRGTGRAVYQGAFLSPDASNLQRGADPLSSLAWEKNIFGTRKQMENQFGKQATEVLNTREQMLDLISKNLNAANDINYSDAFSKAGKIATRLRKAGEPEAADAISEMAENYAKAGAEAKSLGEVAQVVQTQKELLSEKLPESAYGAAGKARGPINQARKAMAGGLKEELEKAASAAIPNGDKILSDANKKLQTLLASKKARAQVAKVEGRRPRMTQLEKYGSVGTAVMSDSPGKGLSFYAIKKALDLLGVPPVTTGLGIGLKKGADIPGLNEAVKRYYINEEQKKQAPWVLMNQNLSE